MKKMFLKVSRVFFSGLGQVFLSLKGSERNSQCFFSSAKRFRTEFLLSFLIFRRMGLNGIVSIFRSAKQTEFRRNESKSICSVFRGKNFFSENGNPLYRKILWRINQNIESCLHATVYAKFTQT